MINILITMGGNGERFRKMGYNVPKYMIMAKGKTLFEWSIESLSSFKDQNPKYIFVVKSEDEAFEFIDGKCKEMGILDFNIVEINELTDGQATTAMLAESVWNSEAPLLIYNIDTHIEPQFISKPEATLDGWIPCFNAPGENWSFVKMDGNRATEVREKSRISDNASVGAYWFKTAALYKHVYQTYYNNEKKVEKGEKYIAPLYNQLIDDGLHVGILYIPYERVHVIGTPKELDVFLASDYKREI